MKLNKINWKQFGRIIIFIDAANIIYSCKDLGWHIKYERLKDYFETKAKRGHISKDLIDVADLFLYLNDFKQYWSFGEAE